jgi:hypothetical protein
MPPTRTPPTSVEVGKLTTRLLDLSREQERLDEYRLFYEVVRADKRVQRQVLDVLGLDNLRELTRSKYESLSISEFEDALAVLLEALDMTLAEAKRLFCDELAWCKRRAGWRRDWARFTRKILGRVPERYRSRLRKLAPAAKWVWDAIQIFVIVPQRFEVTALVARLLAFLAVAGLDRLCGCAEDAR